MQSQPRRLHSAHFIRNPSPAPDAISWLARQDEGPCDSGTGTGTGTLIVGGEPLFAQLRFPSALEDRPRVARVAEGAWPGSGDRLVVAAPLPAEARPGEEDPIWLARVVAVDAHPLARPFPVGAELARPG